MPGAIRNLKTFRRPRTKCFTIYHSAYRRTFLPVSAEDGQITFGRRSSDTPRRSTVPGSRLIPNERKRKTARATNCPKTKTTAAGETGWTRKTLFTIHNRTTRRTTALSVRTTATLIRPRATNTTTTTGDDDERGPPSTKR